MIYLTSDLYLGERFVFKVSYRPFKDLAEMDEEILRRWNNKDEAYIN